jgi:YD repeat-containing protein
VNQRQSLPYYDGLGRLARDVESTWSGSAWVQQSDTRFVYDGMQVAQERSGTGNTVTALYTGGGIGGLLDRAIRSSGNPDVYGYYHYDGLGNVVALTNSSQQVAAGYQYDSYGNLTYINEGGLNGVTNPYRYQTEWQHSQTGLRRSEAPNTDWLVDLPHKPVRVHFQAACNAGHRYATM